MKREPRYELTALGWETAMPFLVEMERLVAAEAAPPTAKRKTELMKIAIANVDARASGRVQ